jgi:hypothetical protein
MTLWILRPVTDWKPWYDKSFGFVVRAENESAARVIASENAGDEGAAAWLKSEETTCQELTADGPATMILRDFASA